MNASLDTNVIIHLYNADFQDVLFDRFDKLIVYQFIRHQELKRHASQDLLKEFDEDVAAGKIQLITDQQLIDIGMYEIFKNHVYELEILFDGGDLGEVYAISIAKTLGCSCLITDDIKERGPHYTLMRFIDSDVIPFAFYELLFLDYLERKTSKEEVVVFFNFICETSDMRMSFTSKLKSFVRRFWHRPYSEREAEWMVKFCDDNSIKAKKRLQELFDYLKTIEKV